MNVLIWIDPLYFNNNPYICSPMANFFGVKFADILKKQLNADVKFVLNEALTEIFEQHNKYEVITIDHFEIIQPLNLSPKDLSRQWYRNTYSASTLDKYRELINTKLEGFKPDIIFSYTPVSFLRKIFPDALTINFETILYSRNPFPLTMYLDPCGNLGDMAVCRFEDELKNFKISYREKNLIQKFKGQIQKIMVDKSPFKSILEPFKKKFDHLVLLPLEIEDHFVFRALCDFNSQFEYLSYVLDHIPSNIGVIVTTHPMNDILNEGMVSFLRKKYPHFIYDNCFKEYLNCSQFLFNNVDAIILVATTLAVQALLWDKKVFSLGKNAYDFVADSNSLEKISEILVAPNKDKDNILYWLLTHYAIPEFYLFDEEWLGNRLKGMLKYKNIHQKLGLDFFEPIDNDIIIIDKTIAALNPDSIPEYSSVRIKSIEENKIIDSYKNEIRELKIQLLKQLLSTENDKQSMKVCLYGAGIFASGLIEEMRKDPSVNLNKIKAVFDISKYKETDNFNGIKILSPNDIKKVNPDIIVITMENPAPIKPFLEDYRQKYGLSFKTL